MTNVDVNELIRDLYRNSREGKLFSNESTFFIYCSENVFCNEYTCEEMAVLTRFLFFFV